MIPGLTDCHTHVVGAGLLMDQLQLRDVGDRESFIAAVAEETSKMGDGAWILGGRWSTESWPDPSPPTRDWVDTVTGDRPLFLTRMDGHQALANSAALRLAGIDRSGPPDPPGGEIVRDPKTHEPTGILKDAAMDLVARHIPPPAVAERYKALTRAMKHLNALGITSIHNMSTPGDLQVFRQAHDRDELTIRIHSFLSVDHWRDFEHTVKEFPVNDDRLRVAGFKGYVDGSLGSRNAYMREPYADAKPSDPYPRGQLTALAESFDHFVDEITWADGRGYQIALHAIGDEANHRALDAYEAAAERNGSKDRRHRIEHVQHLMPEDIARFGALGVVASMQPYHKADDARYAEQAIGRKRAESSYAYHDLMEAGAHFVFGSDWPVVTCSPFEGMTVACSGRTIDGEFWMTQQNIGVEAALAAYTRRAAEAAHQEDHVGTIESGKLADFVILDDDVLEMPADRIRECTVWRTYFAGRKVFDREGD